MRNDIIHSNLLFIQLLHTVLLCLSCPSPRLPGRIPDGPHVFHWLFLQHPCSEAPILTRFLLDELILTIFGFLGQLRAECDYLLGGGKSCSLRREAKTPSGLHRGQQCILEAYSMTQAPGLSIRKFNLFEAVTRIDWGERCCRKYLPRIVLI